MKLMRYIILLFLSFTLVEAASWKLIKNKNAIKVYSRTVVGSEIPEVKGVVKIRTGKSKLLDIFNDTKNFTKWSYNCVKAFEVYDNKIDEKYNYLKINFPFPTKDRDFIVKSKKIDIDKDTVKLVLTGASSYCDNKSSKVCQKTKTDNIRITLLNGFYLFEKIDSKYYRLTYQIHSEPAGSIPSWLVRAMVVDMPFETLKNLRKILEK